MDSAVVKNAAERRSVDPVWSQVQEAAQAAAAADPIACTKSPSAPSLMTIILVKAGNTA